MITLSRFRRAAAALSALSVTALVGVSIMSAVPANAATRGPSVRPNFSIVCSGDACIQTASKSSTLASVNAWANTTTFVGTFQLFNGCGTHVATSPQETWPAGGHHYTFSNIHFADCGDHWTVKAVSGSTVLGAVTFGI